MDKWNAEEGDRVLASRGRGGLDMWGSIVDVDDDMVPRLYLVKFDELDGKHWIAGGDIARLHRGAGPAAEHKSVEQKEKKA